jgi:hypothetical protein
MAESGRPPIAAASEALAPGRVKSTPKSAFMLATAASRLTKAASFGIGIVSSGSDKLATALSAA